MLLFFNIKFSNLNWFFVGIPTNVFVFFEVNFEHAFIDLHNFKENISTLLTHIILKKENSSKLV